MKSNSHKCFIMKWKWGIMQNWYCRKHINQLYTFWHTQTGDLPLTGWYLPNSYLHSNNHCTYLFISNFCNVMPKFVITYSTWYHYILAISASSFEATLGYDTEAIHVDNMIITHGVLVKKVCVTQRYRNFFFRQWLVSMARSYYRNQLWLVVNWAAAIDFNFSVKNAFENVVHQMRTYCTGSVGQL